MGFILTLKHYFFLFLEPLAPFCGLFFSAGLSVVEEVAEEAPELELSSDFKDFERSLKTREELPDGAGLEDVQAPDVGL